MELLTIPSRMKSRLSDKRKDIDFTEKQSTVKLRSSLDHRTHKIPTKSDQLWAKQKEIPQKGVEQPHLHNAVRSQKPPNRIFSVKQKSQISPK